MGYLTRTFQFRLYWRRVDEIMVFWLHLYASQCALPMQSISLCFESLFLSLFFSHDLRGSVIRMLRHNATNKQVHRCTQIIHKQYTYILWERSQSSSHHYQLIGHTHRHSTSIKYIFILFRCETKKNKLIFRTGILTSFTRSILVCFGILYPPHRHHMWCSCVELTVLVRRFFYLIFRWNRRCLLLALTMKLKRSA